MTFSSHHFKVTEVGAPSYSFTMMNQPSLCVNYWQQTISRQDWFDGNKEHLVVLMLNAKHALTGYSLVSIGIVNEALAHPREIFRPAIVSGAFAIVMMHNHPSGYPTPSQADHVLTKVIAEAGRMLQVPLVDHIIVGGSLDSPIYHSFKEAGGL